MASKAVVVRRRRHKNNGFTIPVAVALGFFPLLAEVKSSYTWGGWNLAAKHGLLALTGYNMDNGHFEFEKLRYGGGPIIVGILAHKLIGEKLGVNRLLSKAGIPLLRV